MDWQKVFNEIHTWMIASNQMSQQYPITSDEYWEWVVSSIGEIGNQFGNHPLVNRFLSALMDFQEENRLKLMGGK